MYLLADGVGGQSHGETAAELAISSGQYYVRASRDAFDVSWPFGYDANRSMNENRLMTAIQLANRQLCKLKATSPEHAGAGSTLVGVLVEGSRATVGNVGDSRVYLLRHGVLSNSPSTIPGWDNWSAAAPSPKRRREITPCATW